MCKITSVTTPDLLKEHFARLFFSEVNSSDYSTIQHPWSHHPLQHIFFTFPQWLSIWNGHLHSALPVTGKPMATSTVQKLADWQSMRLPRLQGPRHRLQLHLEPQYHGQQGSNQITVSSWSLPTTSVMHNRMAQPLRLERHTSLPLQHGHKHHR